MKKKFTSFVLVAILAAVGVLGISSSFTASAQSQIGQTPDEYFIQTLQEFGYEQEVEFTKDMLFTETLHSNGLEYVFDIDGEKGFALMIKCFDNNGNQLFDIMELYFDAVSPFSDAQGEKVYIRMFNYIECMDGQYYDLLTGEEINTDTIKLIAAEGFNYRGGSQTGTDVSTVTYNYKSDRSFEFTYGLPDYFLSNYANSCSNIAGGIILGYYDIWYNDLIPNYTTHYYSNNMWDYYSQASSVTNAISDLHFKMQTNVYGGTSVSNFKSGLTSYVADKGRNTSYTSVMSSGNFDYGKYKAQVESGVPVAIFTGKYNAVSKNEFYSPQSGSDLVITYYFGVNHTMVGGGYREVSYNRNETVSVWSPVWYNPFRHVDEIHDVNFRNDTYLSVSFAFSALTKGYIRLNDNITIDDAMGVKIS